MPEFLLLGMAIFGIFGIPIITGWFAQSLGRRFWVWFGLTLIIPLISTAILMYLPDLSDNNKEE